MRLCNEITMFWMEVERVQCFPNARNLVFQVCLFSGVGLENNVKTHNCNMVDIQLCLNIIDICLITTLQELADALAIQEQLVPVWQEEVKGTKTFGIPKMRQFRNKLKRYMFNLRSNLFLALRCSSAEGATCPSEQLGL